MRQCRHCESGGNDLKRHEQQRANMRLGVKKRGTVWLHLVLGALLKHMQDFGAHLGLASFVCYEGVAYMVKKYVWH